MFNINDKIVVTEGTFKGFTGVIIKLLDNKQLKADILIGDTIVPLLLNFEQIKHNNKLKSHR